MDGIDGLVGGCFLVIFGNMFLYGNYSLASLIGAHWIFNIKLESIKDIYGRC